VQLTPSQAAQRLEQEVKIAQDMKQAAFRVSAISSGIRMFENRVLRKV
jgi:hypothetical protein